MNNEFSILKKGYQKLKWFCLDLCFSVGFKTVLLNNKSGGRIIIYHGVSKKVINELNARFISIKKFEIHLSLFKKYFHIVSLKDFFEKPFANDKLTVSITFDDGYRNNFKYVLPLLKKHNIPATFFITAIRSTEKNYLWTDFLDLATLYNNENIIIDNEVFYKNSNNQYFSFSRNLTLKNICKFSDWEFKKKMIEAFPDKTFLNNPNLYDYWKLMNEQEIEKLSKDHNVEIGAHGVYHNYLDNLAQEEALNEIILSKQYLENIIKKNIDFFAYPFGTCSSDLIKLTRKAGFKYQLATISNNSDKTIFDLYDRLTINPYISDINMVYAINKGRY